MLTMTFPNQPFPLAQSIEFEVGQTFGISASVDKDGTCYESGDVSIKVPDLDATFVGRSYEDAEVIVPTSPNLVDHTSPNHLDTFHAFPTYSLPSPSPECYNMSLVEYRDMLEGNEIDCVESLSTFRGYDPSLDPYSLYLGNMPVKIIYTIVCDHLHNFSKDFDKLRRVLTIISRFTFKCSYLHSSKLYT